MPKSIIQPWVAELGLRHQGLLLTAVRGCDVVHREDNSKWLTRFYRSCILQAHVGDPKKAATFMVWTDLADEFWLHANDLIKNHDHLPHHYLMHFVHAIQIVGYYYPDAEKQAWWRDFYHLMCNRFHMNFETQEQMDERLNKTEAEFAAANDVRGNGNYRD